MSGRQRGCRCADCGMLFPDDQKLRLHKQKYCDANNLRESARRLAQQPLPEVADEEFKRKMRELVNTQRERDVKPDTSKTYSTRSSSSYYCSTCCSTCSSETEYMQPVVVPVPVVDNSMDENIRLARWKIRMLQIMHQSRIQELEHNQKHLEAQRAHLLRHIKALNNERVHDKLNLHELTHALEERDVAFKNEIGVIRNDIANFGASEHNTGDILLDLLNEIDDLRILYLRSGGNDPSILSELNLLRSQIMKLQMVRKDRKHHHKHDSMAAHKLAALREQNERLERELIELTREAQNPPVQQTVMMPGPSAVPVPMYDNAFLLSQIQDVRNQIGALLATRAPMPVVAPVAAPMNLPVWNPALHKPANYTEWWRGPHPAGATPTFGAKPYYPTKLGHGFILAMYDFVLGLHPLTPETRLVTTLFTETQEMTEPFVMGNVPAKAGMALVATKQPIQLNEVRSDLYLVIELQVAQADGSFASRGWIRVQLFDKQGRVIGGRFQSPFHQVPIVPLEPEGKIKKIPQYEAAALFYRIADMGHAAIVEQEADANPQFAATYYYRP